MRVCSPPNAWSGSEKFRPYPRPFTLMCKTTREVLQSYHLMPYCPASEHHILVYPPIHIPFSNCVHLNISDIIARVRSCQYIDPIFHPHIKTSHLLKKDTSFLKR